jgi:hypothetical protein
VNAITQLDLFAQLDRQHRPAVVNHPPSAQRRLCPFVVSGRPHGGTGDLPTLVIDGIKGTETTVD